MFLCLSYHLPRPSALLTWVGVGKVIPGDPRPHCRREGGLSRLGVQPVGYRVTAGASWAELSKRANKGMKTAQHLHWAQASRPCGAACPCGVALGTLASKAYHRGNILTFPLLSSLC